MIMNYLVICLSGISLLISCTSQLEYELLPERVIDAEIVPSPDSTYYVIVLLDEKGKIELENITRENIGKEISIVACNKEFFKTKINVVIKSGTIQGGKWESKIDVENFKNKITSNN